MKTIVLIRERHDGFDHDFWMNRFEMEDTDEDPEAKLRDMVKAFLATEEGKHEIARTCQDFNWGDVVQSIPGDFMRAHGIYPADSVTIEILVDQDEVLCNDNDDNDEDDFVGEYDDVNLPF